MRLFACLLICLFACSCFEKHNIPNFLIDSSFSEIEIISTQLDSIYLPKAYRKVQFKENEIVFELMEVQSVDIDKTIKSGDSYNFYFKNYDWHYRLTPISEYKDAYKWEYIYDSRVDRDFSYIIINDLSLKSLPQNQ